LFFGFRFFLIGNFFLVSFFAVSQAPDGYYSLAEGKSDQELKSALHEIIDDHVPFPYSSSFKDTWNILRESDIDPQNSDNVILLYTGESVNGAQESSGWNREHVWPRSRGDFGTSLPTGTDVHNLRACNWSVNSTRSNYTYEDCNSGCENTWDNKYNSSLRIFEPRDEDKGDVARIIFYMDVRYEGDISGEPDLEMIDDIPQSGEPYHGVRTTLLSWHKQDPVDDFEIYRNNIIFQSQENRNPFIDHPDLADYIWGEYQQEPWNPTASLNEITLNQNEIFPNPITRNSFSLKSSDKFHTLMIFDISGKIIDEVQIIEETIDFIKPKGIYIFRLISKENQLNIKVLVK